MIEAKDITDVTIYTGPRHTYPLVASASCVVHGSLKINGIKLIMMGQTLRLVFPERRKPYVLDDAPKREQFFCQVHPVNAETRIVFENMIFSEYRRVISGKADQDQVQEQEMSDAVA